jgi:catechol 2,3-dioxygenase-like lactoylglutathione lyase family enzyme
MLAHSEVHANIPAGDLKRAREFYTQTLGLTPSAEDEYTLTFATPGGSWFQVYETSFAGTGRHTVAQWEVQDIAAEVADLKSRGVRFERYDLPGVEWQDDIAVLPGMKSAWFTDSEGNIMCLDQRA